MNSNKRRRSDLKPLSESLGYSLSKGFLNFTAQKLRVFDIWDRVVGAEDAARARLKQIMDLAPPPSDSHHHHHASHHDSIETVRITEKEPIDWEAFGVWLSMLLHAHGGNLLRVKGLLHIAESEGPVVIQGVQHVIHPPEHLGSWDGLEKATDLVFIMRDLNPDLIRKSFEAFVSGKNR